MPGPWVDLADLKQEVADILHKDAATLAAGWVRQAASARVDGYNDVVNVLLGKGFLMSQLDGWDARVTYTRDQALWRLLVKGTGLADYPDRAVDKLDRRKELADAVTIMVNGVPVGPGAAGQGGAGAAGGRMDEAGYRITTDTQF